VRIVWTLLIWKGLERPHGFDAAGWWLYVM
jgi:hypothetical protein